MSDNGKRIVFGLRELAYIVPFFAIVMGGWYTINANAEKIIMLDKTQTSDHEDLIVLKQDVKGILEDVSEIKEDQKTMNISQQAMALEQKGIAFSIRLILERVNGGQ